jgi:hypothetical protein
MQKKLFNYIQTWHFFCLKRPNITPGKVYPAWLSISVTLTRIFVSYRHHVFNLLNPLLIQLRNVDQSLFSGRDLDKAPKFIRR